MRKRLTEAAIANIEQKAQQANGQKHVTVYGFVSPETKQLVKSIKRINGDWIETDEPPTMLLAEKLERAVVSDKRFIVIVGGRGSAKSVGVIDIMLAGLMDYGDKVYCLREFQTSIKQSIHSLNTEEIKRLQLEGFRCQEAAIYHESGGEFQYAGIKQNPDSIKSAAGFRRYMCEESGSLSEKSITTLTPTARNKAKAGLPGELIEAADELEGVQIWFVANPQASNDKLKPVQAILGGDAMRLQVLPCPTCLFTRLPQRGACTGFVSIWHGDFNAANMRAGCLGRAEESNLIDLRYYQWRHQK